MTNGEYTQSDGEANPKQWRSMTRDERLSLMQTIFICYPRLKALAAKLDLCAQEADRAVANQLYLPECMVIAGDPSVGKTAFVKAWLRQKQQEPLEAGSESLFPYLSISLPPQPDIKSTLLTLLQKAEMHHFIPSSAVTSSLTRMIHQFLRTTPVYLLLIDQCEHLIDRQRQRINYQLLDLVEYLIASTTTSIVLIGHAAEIEMILQASPRLTWRVCSLFRLPPFTWNRRSPETVGEYCAFLHALDRELPFDDSGLAEETMAYRLFYASDGYIGWTTRLIQQAAAMALVAESPTITRSCLAKAYEISIAETPLGWQKTNPFLPEQFKEPGD